MEYHNSSTCAFNWRGVDGQCAALLETLMRETHKSEAEVPRIAFQTGPQQLWREHVLGRYLRKEMSRNES